MEAFIFQFLPHRQEFFSCNAVFFLLANDAQMLLK